MCAVSVMYDYLRDNVPLAVWNRKSWEECKKMLEEVAKLDSLLEQPDCVDEDKTKYAEEVEEKLKDEEKGE